MFSTLTFRVPRNVSRSSLRSTVTDTYVFGPGSCKLFMSMSGSTVLSSLWVLLSTMEGVSDLVFLVRSFGIDWRKSKTQVSMSEGCRSVVIR